MSWWEQGLRLLLAVFIGCVIGIERERKNRPAGMRTHVLVCVGASIIAIMESLMIADTITLNMNNASTGIAISYGRISAQVISGIGFLGAGTIFISQKKIAGLTTAASLWNVACLGLAVGMGYYTISIAGCAIVIITLSLLQRLVRVNSVKHVEIKFIHRVETIAFINDYFQTIGVRVLDIDFHVENKGKYNLYTNIYTLDMQGKTCSAAVVLYFGAFLPRFQPFAPPMEKPQGVLACSLKAFSTMARYRR